MNQLPQLATKHNTTAVVIHGPGGTWSFPVTDDSPAHEVIDFVSDMVDQGFHARRDGNTIVISHTNDVAPMPIEIRRKA